MSHARWAGTMALAALLAAACASPEPQERPQADAELAAALQGVWCAPDAAADDGCWAWDRFDADGTLVMCGRPPGDTGARGFLALATWRVEGRRLCYTVQSVTGDFWLPAGGRWCAEIVTIGPRSQTWRESDASSPQRLLRRPAQASPC